MKGFRFSTNFLYSKTTWTGILGVISILCVQVYHRPDLVEPITAVVLALEGVFIGDKVQKHSEEVKKQLAHLSRDPWERAAGGGSK